MSVVMRKRKAMQSYVTLIDLSLQRRAKEDRSVRMADHR